MDTKGVIIMKQSKLETIKNESEFVNLFEKIVNASIGVIMIRTREPYRAIETLRRYCAERHDPTNSDSQYEFILWDVLHGLQTFANTRKADGTVVIEVKPTIKVDLTTLDLKKAFDKISDNAQKKPSINTITVLFSPQPFFENVGIQQHIKQFTQTALECGHRIVMLCPEVTEIPLAIENDVFVIDYLTPSMSELYNIWDNTYIGEGTPNTYFKHFTAEDKKRIIQNAMGMSASEFENAIAFAMADLGETILEKPETVKPDYIIDRLLKSKTEIIKKTDILELMQVGDLSNVGGLDLLKKWLKLRKGIFSQQARDYGIDIPKGVLLTGSPGTGKSLVAKAIAGEFGLPLVKLDIGRVFSQYVGQSEQRMRKALSIVDSLGNCVLFIDEIDKGLAGTSGSGDSGTTSRVFGTLLTWLQERDKNSTVFLVATANNIVGLPPELMRKGRFDEIFYVGLPTLKERMEIFKIHLGKRNHKNDLDEKALKTVAEHCDKFSGAEIEQTVVNGLIEAFSANQKVVSIDNIIKQIKDTIPLAVSFKEKVDAMEQWAKQNARPASSTTETTENKPKFRKLTIGGHHVN